MKKVILSGAILLSGLYSFGQYIECKHDAYEQVTESFPTSICIDDSIVGFSEIVDERLYGASGNGVYFSPASSGNGYLSVDTYNKSVGLYSFNIDIWHGCASEHTVMDVGDMDSYEILYAVEDCSSGTGIQGCTDTMALNWYGWATIDDGSCEYENWTTGGTNETLLITDLTGYITCGIISWVLIDGDSVLVNWGLVTGDTSFTHNTTYSVDGLSGVIGVSLTVNTDGAGVELAKPSASTTYTRGLDLGKVAGTKGSQEFKGFNVYPVPANENLNLDISSTIETIEVYDINGTLVQAVFGDTKTISVLSLNEGMYTISVQTADGLFRSTFVK
jgi:hypothetical protein